MRHTKLEAEATSAEASDVPGRSAPLHQYLGRCADAMVVTFAEIEDIIDFALPELARSSHDWWTTPSTDTTPSRFADSWIQAKRTARPNLRALTIAFDRVS